MYPEKALITGISGFIAGHLAQSLVADGAEVIGTGRRPPLTAPLLSSRFIPLDVRDFDATVKVFASEKPEVVYHLAATAFLQAAVTEGPRALLETNVAGTWNVLEAARRAEVPVVVVASSDKQYGALAAPPYDDNDSTAFQNGGLYELSKAQQDQVARLYAGLYDTPAIRVARLVNIYGPGDTQWTRIVPGTIRRAYRQERPRITSGKAGEALREYLFVDDAVAGLRRLAQDAAERGNTPLRGVEGRLARVAFNLPSGHKFAAGQMIRTIQQVMQEEFGKESPEPETLPGVAGVFEPGSQFNDDAKLRSVFPAWSPRDLRTGLLQTVPWYLDYFQRAT